MFKVRCKFIPFDGDEEMFLCHFNCKIGDEFYYDGVHFTGRICPGLLASMMPVIYGVHFLGYRYSGNTIFKYRGIDSRDPSKAKYDGLRFSPREKLPEGTPGYELYRDS